MGTVGRSAGQLIWMEHWICLVAIAVLAGVAWGMKQRARRQAAEAARERRMREELQAYTELDVSLVAGAGGMSARGNASEAERALAKRVCRAIGEKSVFSRVTMLLRNPEGRFACVGSVGADDLTVAALHAWGEQVVEEERGGEARVGARNPAKSFSVALGEWRAFDREVGSWAASGRRERRRWRRGIIVPIRFGVGRMAGAIAVCADGEVLDRLVQSGEQGWMTRAMLPIESLASRIATAMENEAMGERLARSEKLAGLGQLAGGVAHALNNPLTAVLGFAELIAESAAESRVALDARTIVSEALKMKATVGRLVEFWQPAVNVDEAVDVMAMLREIEAACVEKLAARGVKLEIVGANGVPQLRGGRARLRQVMEHLLNNSAEAIAGFRPLEDGEGEHKIRVTVSFDERALQLIVSDTGPGFAEPARVFDPYYTTNAPTAGAGMGLSVSYGIVREHAGEISAFNLHPRGAAVVVELPVRKAVVEEDVVARERVHHHG
jgi:signal transduction histidine kinase